MSNDRDESGAPTTPGRADDSVDRSIKDIVTSMMRIANKARFQKQYQLARDLEKLCVAASMVDPERLN